MIVANNKVLSYAVWDAENKRYETGQTDAIWHNFSKLLVNNTAIPNGMLFAID